MKIYGEYRIVYEIFNEDIANRIDSEEETITITEELIDIIAEKFPKHYGRISLKNWREIKEREKELLTNEIT